MSADFLMQSALEACNKIEDQETRDNIKTFLSNLGEQLDRKNDNSTHSSEEKLRLSFDKQSSSMLCFTNPQLQIKRFNDNFLHFLGYTQSELINKPFHDLIKKDSQNFFQETIIKQLKASNSVQNIELPILKKNGEHIEIAFSAVVQNDNDDNWTEILISLDNIGELKKAKLALANIEQHFEHLYQSTFAIIYSIDHKNSKILNVSDCWLSNFGYSSEEVIGHHLDEFMREESKKYFNTVILNKCLKGKPFKEIPMQFLKKDGQSINVLLSATIENDLKENTRKAFFIFEDVTLLKKAEDALKEKITKENAILSAIQTPLKEGLNKLLTLKEKIPKNLQEELSSVLENLSSDNLLRPYFSLPDASMDLDREINKWLIKEYSMFATSYAYSPPSTLPPLDKNNDLGKLNSLNFNSFDYINNQFELIDLLIQMFEHFDLLHTFHISKDSLNFFLHKSKTEYRNVPYHNFLHAFDVTQMVFYFLTKGDLCKYLTELDIFSLLISTIGHDICHPGLNNNFQEMTQSPLALTYNDQSILENYHLSNIFQIIYYSGCNLFKNLSQGIVNEIRKVIISNILATDMKYHFEILTLFSNRSKKSKIFDRLKSEDRLLLMKLSLKCADVGNPARPYRISKKWTEHVMNEFFLQGDLEKTAGLPVSSFMDRESTSIAKSQTAFIEFIAKPLFGSFALIFPNIQECAYNLEENSRIWNKILLKEESDRNSNSERS